MKMSCDNTEPAQNACMLKLSRGLSLILAGYSEQLARACLDQGRSTEKSQMKDGAGKDTLGCGCSTLRRWIRSR